MVLAGLVCMYAVLYTFTNHANLRLLKVCLDQAFPLGHPRQSCTIAVSAHLAAPPQFRRVVHTPKLWSRLWVGCADG